VLEETAMARCSIKYQTYVKILERELVCAMGCTEPIALAYCAAKARAVLGTLPERIQVAASGNITKNVKSVVVPNTGGRCGIETAAAIGALGGEHLLDHDKIRCMKVSTGRTSQAFVRLSEKVLANIENFLA
jgi:L-cysteine desulfidase